MQGEGEVKFRSNEKVNNLLMKMIREDKKTGDVLAKYLPKSRLEHKRLFGSYMSSTNISPNNQVYHEC
jgi:hypothetical protein